MSAPTDEVVRSSDLVFVCVKPDLLNEVVAELLPLEDDHSPLFVSVVAGVALVTLEEVCVCVCQLTCFFLQFFNPVYFSFKSYLLVSPVYPVVNMSDYESAGLSLIPDLGQPVEGKLENSVITVALCPGVMDLFPPQAQKPM